MSFIMNFQSPKTFDDLFDRFEFDGLTNIDHILQFEETIKEWTVDKTTKQGELVFFSCAKTSVDHMKRLLGEVKRSEASFMDEEAYAEFLAFTQDKVDLYARYAGHLVAIGKVASSPFRVEHPGYSHAAWSSQWYAKIDDFRLLDSPIPFSAIRDFVTISRTGSRTRLTDQQVERLMTMID